jgi:hypothetical protein
MQGGIGAGGESLEAVRRRIKELVTVLEDFGSRRDPAYSRADYIARVSQCVVYGCALELRHSYGVCGGSIDAG